MTTYTKSTDFASKDALLSGNPSKVVKGVEIDTEFNNIASADATSLKSGGSLGTPSAGVLTNATGLPISTGVTGLGTGVATSLAVNVGSAGAPVVNGGALGTPSSGTVTNLTGTASININGTVGATTPASGAFTSLSASSTVSGSGFDAYLASPPAIGGTVAAAGTFTNLTATGNATLGDAEATDTHAIKGATTVLANSASPAMKVTQTGAGNAFVVEDSASTDSTPFVIDASGKVIVGHTATIAGGYGDIAVFYELGALPRHFLQAYSADIYAPVVEFAKSRNAAIGSHTVVQANDELGTIRFSGSDGTAYKDSASIRAFVDGTPGTNDMPGRLVFSTTADGASSPTEALRINSSQGVLATGLGGLGYGTGAGGTVTQATSKSTAVTLNKPTGQITMNNAALAAGTEVFFSLTNSLITAYDVVICNLSVSLGGSYIARCSQTYTGGATIGLKNITAGSLSESPVINFAVIKGVTS